MGVRPHKDRVFRKQVGEHVVLVFPQTMGLDYPYDWFEEACRNSQAKINQLFREYYEPAIRDFYDTPLEVFQRLN